MRLICLALATTAVGIAGLLSTAGAEEANRDPMPSTGSAAAPSPATGTGNTVDITPELHYVTADTAPADATPAVGAARIAPNSLTAGRLNGRATAQSGTQSAAANQQVGALQYQQEPNWSAQLQYSYMAVGKGSGAVNACCDAHDSWRIDRQLLAMQFGLSYHFK